MEIKAKDFQTRQKLEDYIKAEFGMNMEQNRLAGHTIIGTRKELKQKSLSDLTTCYGVRCIITDTPTAEIVKQKPKPVPKKKKK